MKICSKCNCAKNFDNFYKCSKSKTGYQSQCKSCKSISVKNSPSYKKKYIPSQDALVKLRSRKLAYYHKTKIARNISRRMRQSISGKKSTRWESLVDYTLVELKEHLESLFQEGMSWENYGKWHIDHIIPVSSFNITSTDCQDFKTCWSITNLQPLWAIDNFVKGSKIII